MTNLEQIWKNNKVWPRKPKYFLESRLTILTQQPQKYRIIHGVPLEPIDSPLLHPTRGTGDSGPSPHISCLAAYPSATFRFWIFCDILWLKFYATQNEKGKEPTESDDAPAEQEKPETSESNKPTEPEVPKEEPSAVKEAAPAPAPPAEPKTSETLEEKKPVQTETKTTETAGEKEPEETRWGLGGVMTRECDFSYRYWHFRVKAVMGWLP